jgi:hypothetical protein
MRNWVTARWRARLKLALFSLIPLVLILAMAQACAYVSVHRSVGVTTDSLTGLQYYSMRIGRWPWSHRSLTPINSLGLPDGEFAGLGPKGDCTHVLLAGDSFTFGDGTSSVYRWGTVLQGMTARRIPDRCVRFFNIGVSNSTIDTAIARIRQVMPLIQPDVVILGQYQNDLTDLANPGSPAWEPRRPGQAHDSHWGTRLGRLVPGYNVSLFRFLTYRSFAFLIENDIQYDVLGTWSVLEGESKQALATKFKTIYRDLFGELVTDMRARGIEVAVLIFPSKMDVLAKRYPEGVYFAGLAREFNVPHLSLMPALDAHRSPMPFYLYDGHLNERGNGIVAGAVWNWLFESDSIPVAALRRSPGATMAGTTVGGHGG